MSKTSLCTALFGLAALAAPMACADDYRISGPYTHDNLSIFLIHSIAPAVKPPGNYLTLKEALDQKKVLVAETGNVNELTIQNLGKMDIYIQSGDIVKGGRQDRVFPDDYLVTSASGKVPIPAYCVEHGRWSRRGSEAAEHFTSSNLSLPNKSLKLAARGASGQSGSAHSSSGYVQQQVWDEVGKANQKIAVNAGYAAEPAPPSASQSSLEMAMENKQVHDVANAYVEALSGAIDGKSDVVGFAFAINGKINSADVYPTNSMFARMWPKLLQASAIEAMSERQESKAVATPEPSAVLNLLTTAENGKETDKVVANRLLERKTDSDTAVLFETRDRKAGGAWIHRNYVAK